MNLLITSGGTSESIDRVRSITNHASGRLGKILAEKALEKGHSVTLVCGQTAVLPNPHPLLTIHRVTDVADLQATLEQLVPTHQALVHSMAVSDYTPIYMAGLEEVEQEKDIRRFLSQHNTQGKISSREEVQVLFLQKTPKILSLIKQWNPAICLIGFKLLVNVPTSQLLEVAQNSLLANQADYIVANDLTGISDTQHLAYLVGHKDMQQVHTKDQLAQLLLDTLEEALHG